MKKVVLMYLALVLFVYNSKAQNAVDLEQRIKKLENSMTALTQQLNTVSAENQRLKNTIAGQTVKMLQSYAISVPSNIRNSWADVKFKPGEQEITQLKVPADGEYLLLANLKVTDTEGSDEEFQLQVLRDDNDALIDEATVYQKSNSLPIQKGELATWTIVNLKRGQLIRLKYRMKGTASNSAYSYSHAKLALIKL